MSSRILTGDVFDMLPTIAPGSVDCVVTSPPYWMLRSYLPKDHPLKSRELGSEKTPGEFVARMVEVFRLVRDCMADHATCWLNMGDSYSSKPAGCKGVSGSSTLNGARGDTTYRETLENSVSDKRDTTGAVPAGNLCLIPQRLAIALADDGWLVRSVVIWHKPAPMPASVAGWRWMRCRVKTSERNCYLDSNPDYQHAKAPGNKSLNPATWSDCPGCAKCRPNGGLVLRRGSWRPTSSWEPILMLAKRSGYYADGEAVKTPAKRAGEIGHLSGAKGRAIKELGRSPDDPLYRNGSEQDGRLIETAAGANLRDVWTIAAEPLAEKHYAAFPTELVRLCLKAGTSEKGYCAECGKPWARVMSEASGGSIGQGGWVDNSNRDSRGMVANNGVSGTSRRPHVGQPEYMPGETLGWRPTCSHETEPRPALVLDPFAGSGRTGVTAQRMFLDFVGVELNPDYAAMSQRILRDDCPLFSDTA